MQCDGHSEFALPLSCSIWRAAQTNQLSRIQQIINRGIQTVNSRDESGYTALHYAARSGNMPITMYLLSHRAEPNSEYSGGDSSLHRAAFMGHIDIAESLIQAKANIDHVNSDKQTPLHRAAANQKKTMITFLLNKQADPTKQDKHGRTFCQINIDAALLLAKK